MPKESRAGKGLGDRLRKLGVTVSGLPKGIALRPSLLLCGNVPKPLHCLAPRVVLGAKWWNETRRAAYDSTSYHCLACGVSRYAAKYHQWMEGHEVYRIDYRLGTAEYLETVPLCHSCHCFIHSGRLEAMRSLGKIPEYKYRDIIEHGNAVLSRAKLKKPEPYPGPFAEWGKWRLIIGKRKYKPKFKNLEHWERYHRKLNGEIDE